MLQKDTIGRLARYDLLSFLAVYSLILRQASSLVSLLAIFQLVLLLIILPAISSIMTNSLGLDAKTKDLYICRGSIILLLVGATGIGFSAVPALAIACKSSDT